MHEVYSPIPRSPISATVWVPQFWQKSATSPNLISRINCWPMPVFHLTTPPWAARFFAVFCIHHADSLQFVATAHFSNTSTLMRLQGLPGYSHILSLFTRRSDSVQLLGFIYTGNLLSLTPLYAISVRQARVLLPPFFRFYLTTDTLGLGYILPAAGWIRDFRPLERALTWRTITVAPSLRMVPQRSALLFVCVVQKELVKNRDLHESILT